MDGNVDKQALGRGGGTLKAFAYVSLFSCGTLEQIPCPGNAEYRCFKT